ncbi:kinase-like protein [Atractiella rhizophila]|nr:kinase-like protein [Atractiella rhizophila]
MASANLKPIGQLRVLLSSASNINSANGKPKSVRADKDTFFAIVSYDQTETISPRSSSNHHPQSYSRPNNGQGTSIPKLTRTKSGLGVTVQSRSVENGRDDGSKEEKRDKEEWSYETIFDVVDSNRALRIALYEIEPPERLLGVRELPITDCKAGAWEKTATVSISSGNYISITIHFTPVTSTARLSPDSFLTLLLLGRGSFGRVHAVQKKDTGRVYAMKVLSKAQVLEHRNVEQVLAERRVLQIGRECRFLVGLKFSFQSKTELFFVMDYKSGGELFAHLQRVGGKFEESRVRFYVGQIVLALQFLHNHRIIYRDLKPENCLLDAEGHIALCDFGLSKLDFGAYDLTRTFCGTTEYLAPEIIMEEGYGFPVDFWSLGVLLFEMCFGWSPFYAEERREKYLNILQKELKIPKRPVLTLECNDLLMKLLTRNPLRRIGAIEGTKEIKRHPFFHLLDWTALERGEIPPPFKPSASDALSSSSPSTHTKRSQRQSSEYRWKSRRSSVIGKGPREAGLGGGEDEGFSRSILQQFRGFTFARETRRVSEEQYLRKTKSRKVVANGIRQTKASSFSSTPAISREHSKEDFEGFDGWHASEP